MAKLVIFSPSTKINTSNCSLPGLAGSYDVTHGIATHVWSKGGTLLVHAVVNLIGHVDEFY